MSWKRRSSTLSATRIAFDFDEDNSLSINLFTQYFQQSNANIELRRCENRLCTSMSTVFERSLFSLYSKLESKRNAHRKRSKRWTTTSANVWWDNDRLNYFKMSTIVETLHVTCWFALMFFAKIWTNFFTIITINIFNLHRKNEIMLSILSRLSNHFVFTRRS